MAKKAKKNLFSRRNWKIAAAIGLIIILVAALELTNTTHIFHHSKAVSGTIPSTQPASASNGSKSSANSSTQATPVDNGSSGTNSKDSTASSATSGPLMAPYGTFVSNHRPSLSGAGSVPSGEQSVCNTTPGAQCYINFTNGGVIKTLEAQIADSKGAVYWSWDVNKAGFTVGTWTITATATLNGQSQSTKDSLSLTVNP